MKASRRQFLTTAAAATLACGRGGAPRKRRLSIAAGITGGVFYPYGGGIAKVVSETLPDVEVTAEATSGSIDNLKFLQVGKADIAFTIADTLEDAVKGRGAFQAGSPVDARSVASLYDNLTHIVTLADSGIRQIGDLRGRQVSVGAPGSGTETVSVRILEAAGIDPKAGITRQQLGNDAVDALKDGKLDAFFWSGGVPTGSLLDLAATPGRRMALLPSESVLPELQKRFGPLYTLGTIPKSAYPGLEADVPVVAVMNVLVVDAGMDEELVYRLTRTLFEKQKDLQAIHPEAAKLQLARAVTGSPAPFHPGAIRYYQEKGAWPK